LWTWSAVFASVDEHFAGAVGFDALTDQDLPMRDGNSKIENGKEKVAGWGEVKVPTL
jgi:hypothetical protein